MDGGVVGLQIQAAGGDEPDAEEIGEARIIDVARRPRDRGMEGGVRRDRAVDVMARFHRIQRDTHGGEVVVGAPFRGEMRHLGFEAHEIVELHAEDGWHKKVSST